MRPGPTSKVLSCVGISILSIALALAPGSPASGWPSSLPGGEAARLVGGCSEGDHDCACAEGSCGGTGAAGINPCLTTSTVCELENGKCRMIVANTINYCGAPNSNSQYGCDETVDPASFCAYVLSAPPNPNTVCATKPKSSQCVDSKTITIDRCGDPNRTCRNRD